MELEAKLFMEQFTQANGRVLEDPGQILRVVQVIFNKVLHLFQHGAVARPGREGQPVAVNLAVQHIVDGNLDRAARLVSVPVFLVYRLHPGLRLGQRHAGASGKMLVGALHDGDDGFLFRGQVGQGGLLGGFEQGHKRPGNITGEVPPAGGRAPDGAKAIFEKAGHDACALAQQVFHIPAQVPGDLFHTAVGIYGDHSFPKSGGAALAAPDKMSKFVSI